MPSGQSSRPTVGHKRHSSIGNLIKRFSKIGHKSPVQQQTSRTPSIHGPIERTSISQQPLQRAPRSDPIVPRVGPTLAEAAARPSNFPRTRTAPTAVRPVPVSTIHIRRTCHLCGNLFIRTERVCQDCNHALCSRCPRDPPALARTPSAPPGEDLHSEPRPVPEELAATAEEEGEEPEVTLAAVKRTRHYHTPHDSHTEPRLREWKKPRHRIRYLCDQCGTTFAEKGRVCQKPGCGHRRCEKCPREPPRRHPEGEHDPEVLRKLEARISAYVVVQSNAAAAATAMASSAAATAAASMAAADAVAAGVGSSRDSMVPVQPASAQ